MMRLPLSSILIFMVHCLSITMAQGRVSLSKPGCPEDCGNVTVPYPFGIGSECSANADFTVVCNYTINPPKPYLQKLKLEALAFSIDRKIVRVTQGVFPLLCNSIRRVILVGQILSSNPFRYSTVYNSLVVVGCNNSVSLLDYGARPSFGGCAPICGPNTPKCNGLNCCQTTIPSQYGEPEIFYTTEPRRQGVCGYAFMSDHRWLARDYLNYIGNSSDFPDPASMSLGDVPMVLEWDFDVPEESLRWPVKCVNDSVSYSPSLDDGGGDSVNSTRCYCEAGFEGNPYLPGSGCQDFDECSNGTATSNRCMLGSTCVNTVGSYRCMTPDDNKQTKSAAMIGVTSATGALLLLGGAWMFSKVVRKRIKANRGKRFFKRNGGLLLQQQLSSSDGGVENIKLFRSKELNLATDRYNENRILGRGGQGTVYKGMLPDGRIVAVKKSKKVDEGDIEVFINEVVILSQINHRNIVKLLGCCLETEVPLLVYEFIPNGTLYHHIHDQNNEFPLSWKMRIRIATEVAGALSYLHYAASSPIYHRDVKSTNILLDDKYRAKVSDFGTSRSIAIDQTHLTTRVLGTFGYLDPEYFQSSQFTEKSDVYSFGVVMVELMTGEKAISAVRDETGRSLATHFLHSMDENRLFDILDPEVLKEGRTEEITAVAKLAMRCLNLNGKKRPTMKEVTSELEGIQTLKEGLGFVSSHDDTKFHSVEVYEDYDFPTISDSSNLNVIVAESKSPLLFSNS